MNATPEQKTVARTKMPALKSTANQIDRAEDKIDNLRDKRNLQIFELSKTPGVTQSMLAEAAGVGETFVRNCIKGEGDPIAGSKL